MYIYIMDLVFVFIGFNIEERGWNPPSPVLTVTKIYHSSWVKIGSGSNSNPTHNFRKVNTSNKKSTFMVGFLISFLF